MCVFINNLGVGQLGSPLRLERRGRWFKSNHPDQISKSMVNDTMLFLSKKHFKSNNYFQTIALFIKIIGYNIFFINYYIRC